MKKIILSLIFVSIFFYFISKKSPNNTELQVKNKTKEIIKKRNVLNQAQEKSQIKKEVKPIDKAIPTDNPEYHSTPLLREIESGNFEATVELIQRGANIEQESLNGRTPIIAAIEQNRTDIIKLLIDNGLNFNKTFGPDKINYLMYASLNNNIQTIKMLADKINVNSKDDAGKTAAHHAVIQGSDDALYALLHLKANFKIKDSNGKDIFDYINEQEPEIKLQLERVFER